MRGHCSATWGLLAAVSMLNQKTISEFQSLYKKKTGIDLPDIDAETKALELLNFMKLVYRPIRKEIKDGEIK